MGNDLGCIEYRMDVKELKDDPSWINAGYLFWDVGSAFLPFVPGSYAVKAVKKVKGKKIVKKLVGDIPSSMADLKKVIYLR